MKKYDQISTLFWFLFGLYIIQEGYAIHLGILREPGPGFLLFWSGVVLCGLSALTFFKAQFSKEKESEKMWEGIKWHKPLLILMISFVYVLFFARLGFLLSTFILVLLLFKFTEPQKWSKVLVSSFLSVFFCWLIFDFCLKCQFPKGLLENLIFPWLKLLY